MTESVLLARLEFFGSEAKMKGVWGKRFGTVKEPWGVTPVPTPQLQRLLIVFSRRLFVTACRYMYPSLAVFYRLFQQARMSQLHRLVGHSFHFVYAACRISGFGRGGEGPAFPSFRVAVARFWLRHGHAGTV